MKRLQKIKQRLAEFEAELQTSNEDLDQFQVGYYVHHTDIRWLLAVVEDIRTQ